MSNLLTLRMSDLVAYNHIASLGNQASSMENVAHQIVTFLYENLVDDQEQTRSCALVRFFKVHPYHALDAENQRFAADFLGNPMPEPDTKCLTLLATVGDKPAWNDRRQSVQHKAIPLPSPELIRTQMPMIGQLITQFGLAIDSVTQSPDPDVLLYIEPKIYNVFYVSDARNSPYVPNQQDFVIPYGIRSVIGFGGFLPTGDLFSVILFTKVFVPHQVVEVFRSIALSVKLAVLPFSNGPIFASDGEGYVNRNGTCLRDDLGILRSQVTTLYQLLETHGRIVAEQTSELDSKVREVSEKNRQLQQHIQVIESQQATLRELSIPLIPITDEILIMPLIGTIDSRRVQMVMESLLEGVARYQASLVILDITGVALVDTQVAQAFIQVARAVRLLGCQVMLTGIQPQIAQTLVHLGVDLSGLLTHGSLQSGIAAALR